MHVLMVAFLVNKIRLTNIIYNANIPIEQYDRLFDFNF